MSLRLCLLVIAVSAIGNATARADDTADFFAAVGRAAKLSQAADYAGAAKEYESVLGISARGWGETHTNHLVLQVNLANVYVKLGRYADAEPIYLRVLKVRETTSGPEHADVILPLVNLANLYNDMGQYHKAGPSYRRAATLQEKHLGPEHPQLAATLNGWAAMYQRLKRSADAEPLYLRALKIREAAFGPEHPEVARTLSGLAVVYLDSRQFAQAEPLLLRSLKIQEAKLGPEHPHVGETLNDLAILYHRWGRDAEAEPLQRRSLRIFEAKLGPNHPDVGKRGYHNLAVLEIALGRPKEAAAAFDRARRIVRRHAARVLPLLSEGEQLLFLNAVDRRDLQVALSLALHQPGDANIAAQSAAWLANGKAVAQDSLAARARGATVLPEAEEWITAAALREALPADTVLIDLARMYLHPFTPEKDDKVSARLPEHYVAWIVPPAGTAEVKVVDLGSAAAIDAAVAAYQAEMQLAQTGAPLKEHGEVAAEKALRARLADLSRLVLEPLRPHLGAAQRLVLSPDAGLWLVPWAALPVEDQYAVERWELRFVTSGREVALEKRRTNAVTLGPARILANPDYDLTSAELLAAYQALFYPGAKLPPPPPTPRSSTAADDAFVARSIAALGVVGPLPGSAVEAAAIAPQLKTFTQADPKVYTERQAQEGVLKLIKNPRVLLLSTHGFFLPEPQTRADDTGDPESPLLRCGLLFAGCNRREKTADPRIGDGVLTGAEIVGCDFRGTELVVLSACETGLGAVNNGEGVAGLRQAFQLAGARSVVSTLWQIPDKQSAVLMNDFFTNLAAGQSKAESLRNAQLALLKSRREKFGAAHPLFWAAWTVTGN